MRLVRVLVCLEPRPRRTEDGIDVLPAGDFAARPWRGDIVYDGPLLEDACATPAPPMTTPA